MPADNYAFKITAKSNTSKVFAKMQADLKGIGGAIAGVGGKVAALAGVGGFGLLIASSLKTVDALAKTSDKLGITTEGLGRLQFAVSQTSDITEQGFNKALEKMVVQVSDAAQGTGLAKDAIEELGLSASELSDAGPEESFKQIADAMQGVESQSDRARLAYDIFGRSGVGLVNTLRNGSDGLEEMGSQAEKMGIIISRIDAAKIEAANDAIDRAQKSVQGMGQKIAVQMAPYLESMANAFSDLSIENNGFRDEILSGAESVVLAVAKMADIWRGLEVVWKGLEVAFWGMATGVLAGLDKLSEGAVKLINYLPGVDVAPSANLSQWANDATASLAKSVQELDKLALKEMPGDGIKAFFEEIKQSANEAAISTANVLGTSSPDEEEEGVSFNIDEDPEILKARARIEALTLLKEVQATTDAENEELAFLNKMEILRTRFESGELPTLQSFDAIKAKLAAKHENNLTKISNKGLTERQKFEKKTTKAQTKQVFGELANITAGVASHNKTLFKINKVAGIATALINTAIGVSESLKAYPMPVAAVMAAAHLAAGMAQVSAIKSQSYGGSGGSSGSAAVGTTPITTAPSNLSLSNAVDEKEESEGKSNVIEITVNIDPESSYRGSDIREMMERIGDEAGYNVRF